MVLADDRIRLELQYKTLQKASLRATTKGARDRILSSLAAIEKKTASIDRVFTAKKVIKIYKSLLTDHSGSLCEESKTIYNNEIARLQKIVREELDAYRKTGGDGL